ncbi:MAG: VOC family protein [Alphaproteobacteria bacterium]
MEPRLSLITLGVADVERSRAFYEGLGWRASSASVAGEVVFFQLGGLALALYGRAALAADAGGNTVMAAGAAVALAHNVRERDEVDATIAEFVAGGGRILRPASEAEWGGRFGYVADPDGHVWEIAWNPHFGIASDGGLHLPD